MIHNFLVAFFVFLVLRYIAPRKFTGNDINYIKAVIHSVFFAFSYITLKKWNAYDKVRREQRDTDKAFH